MAFILSLFCIMYCTIKMIAFFMFFGSIFQFHSAIGSIFFGNPTFSFAFGICGRKSPDFSICSLQAHYHPCSPVISQIAAILFSKTLPQASVIAGRCNWRAVPFPRPDTISMPSFLSFHNPDLLLCQPVQLIDQGVYLPVGGLDLGSGEPYPPAACVSSCSFLCLPIAIVSG